MERKAWRRPIFSRDIGRMPRTEFADGELYKTLTIIEQTKIIPSKIKCAKSLVKALARESLQLFSKHHTAAGVFTGSLQTTDDQNRHTLRDPPHVMEFTHSFLWTTPHQTIASFLYNILLTLWTLPLTSRHASLNNAFQVQRPGNGITGGNTLQDQHQLPFPKVLSERHK
ncbi:MAG: hypothetical protein Q9163_004445 [Psora crenata]